MYHPRRGVPPYSKNSNSTRQGIDTIFTSADEFSHAILRWPYDQLHLMQLEFANSQCGSSFFTTNVNVSPQPDK